MFTGIVEELGEVVSLARGADSAYLQVRTRVSADAGHGDSVAVNGVCLTVTANRDGVLGMDVMGETLARTDLGDLVSGDRVNLERAVPAGGRLDGHIVQGHVDGTATVLADEPGDNWRTMWFSLPAELAGYVAEKGSIAVDGVSLTVSGVAADRFGVGLIPTTLAATTLGSTSVGDRVNLEADVLAKYVARLLAAR